MRIIASLILAIAASGCRPSDLCSEPTEDPCDQGCSAVPVQRDNEDCAETMHLCVAEFAVGQPAQTCVVDPEGVAYVMRSRVAMEELFELGWHACEGSEGSAFPTQSCAP